MRQGQWAGSYATPRGPSVFADFDFHIGHACLTLRHSRCLLSWPRGAPPPAGPCDRSGSRCPRAGLFHASIDAAVSLSTSKLAASHVARVCPSREFGQNHTLARVPRPTCESRTEGGARGCVLGLCARVCEAGGRRFWVVPSLPGLDTASRPPHGTCSGAALLSAARGGQARSLTRPSSERQPVSSAVLPGFRDNWGNLHLPGKFPAFCKFRMC